MPGVVGPREKPRGSGTVFLYLGQGSQWAGIGRQLLVDEPAFAAAVAELEPDFVGQVGFSLRDVLLAGEPVVGIDRIQPVLVGMQLALTALWRSYGVEPDAVIGHSMGEVTAAVVAGALSPADGLKVIVHPVEVDVAAVRAGRNGVVGVGRPGSREVTSVSIPISHGGGVRGPGTDGDRRAARTGGRGDRGGGRAGRLARRVEVDVASHHPTVDPILAELRDALADLKPMTPRIPLISTVRSGRRRCGAEVRCRLLGR